MRLKMLLALALMAILLSGSQSRAVEIDAALSIEDGRVSSFYLAIGSHYEAPEKDLIFVKKRGISDDEMTVVFFLAREARVAPAIIVDLRLSGMTWMEISTRYHLTAKIFYVEIAKSTGPPFGKAHGHFRNRHRDEWHQIKLADADIVNLVNLKFVTVHYGYSVDEVVKMREEGQSYIAIHDKVKTAKAKGKAKTSDKDKKGTDKKGKGKGKGK
jgi:hypothetical protein